MKKRLRTARELLGGLGRKVCVRAQGNDCERAGSTRVGFRSGLRVVKEDGGRGCSRNENLGEDEAATVLHLLLGSLGGLRVHGIDPLPIRHYLSPLSFVLSRSLSLSLSRSLKLSAGGDGSKCDFRELLASSTAAAWSAAAPSKFSVPSDARRGAVTTGRQAGRQALDFPSSHGPLDTH